MEQFKISNKINNKLREIVKELYKKAKIYKIKEWGNNQTFLLFKKYDPNLYKIICNLDKYNIQKISDYIHDKLMTYLKTTQPSFRNKSDFQQFINKYDIVIFGAEYCPWCSKAMKLIKNKKNCRYIELTLLDPEPFSSFSKKDSIPEIYKNGILLGGFTELEQLFKKK